MNHATDLSNLKIIKCEAREREFKKRKRMMGCVPKEMADEHVDVAWPSQPHHHRAKISIQRHQRYNGTNATDGSKPGAGESQKHRRSKTKKTSWPSRNSSLKRPATTGTKIQRETLKHGREASAFDGKSPDF